MQTSFYELLQYNRRCFPDRTALTVDDRSLTFAELASRVDDARRVLGERIHPGDRVALWLPNSFGWVTSFFAIASLGAITVPVNTRLTGEELSVILEDAGVQLVLAAPCYRGRDYVEEARASGAGIVPLVGSIGDDAPPEQWRIDCVHGYDGKSAAFGRDDIFCIQYTSGTTSTPKGVLLTQPLYLQTAAHVVRCQMLTPNRSFMSAAPFFHCSGSMHAITVCLLAGCALHTVSTWDPDYFLDLIERHRGDTGHGIFFRDIVELGESARRRIRTLKVAIDIGSEEFIRKLHDDFGVTGISNIYGMTETGGNFTMWYPDDPLDKRIRMNGRPQAGNEIRIVDPDSGTLAKVGETGEIQMRGRTVTPGYYNRPEANASTFVDGGWFRSGDLGSISAEGELQYIARLRDVIRVGGENVSPAEVEHVVAEVTGLKEISVVGIPDGRLGEIAALVYCSSDDHDWPSTLEAMGKKLAGFKLPRRVYKADAMPMTATNKVQRVTLQKWIREDELARII